VKLWTRTQTVCLLAKKQPEETRPYVYVPFCRRAAPLAAVRALNKNIIHTHEKKRNDNTGHKTYEYNKKKRNVRRAAAVSHSCNVLPYVPVPCTYSTRYRTTRTVFFCPGSPLLEWRVSRKQADVHATVTKFGSPPVSCEPAVITVPVR